MTRFLDTLFDSINEFFDVIVFSFITSYIYSGFILYDSWLLYVIFPVIPLFVVYSPYVSRMQTRSTPELIFKTLIYLIVGFGTFYGTNLIIGDLFQKNIAPIFMFLLFFVFAFMLFIWIIQTLVRHSKEKVFIPYKERKTSKASIFALIIAAGSWMFTFSSFGMVFSPESSGAFDVFLYTIIGLISIIIAVISTLFLFMNLLQRKR